MLNCLVLRFVVLYHFFRAFVHWNCDETRSRLLPVHMGFMQWYLAPLCLDKDGIKKNKKNDFLTGPSPVSNASALRIRAAHPRCASALRIRASVACCYIKRARPMRVENLLVFED